MDTTKLKGRLENKVQELQKPVEITAETTLAPSNSYYMALRQHRTISPQIQRCLSSAGDTQQAGP